MTDTCLKEVKRVVFKEVSMSVPLTNSFSGKSCLSGTFSPILNRKCG